MQYLLETIFLSGNLDAFLVSITMYNVCKRGKGNALPVTGHEGP
jgi:hypothetical protein